MSFPRIKVDYAYHAPRHKYEWRQEDWRDQFDGDGNLLEPIERPLSFRQTVRLSKLSDGTYVLENSVYDLMGLFTEED